MNEDTTKVCTLAIDLAKRVFQVLAADAREEVLWEARYPSREGFAGFLQTLQPPMVVLMETGPGAQAWARALQERGLTVRVLPAQRVAEHRSGAKNDRNDARAILRAGRDAAIHAVPVKSVERLTMQALHRVRSGYQRRRTALSNQMRGLLLEHGIAMAKGDAALTVTLSRVLGDASAPIPDRLRDLVAELWAEWEGLNERSERLSVELAQAARVDPVGRRLMTVPGIGPIIATALVCKEIAIEQFVNARQFAAYFGLVPDQHSSGNRIRLGRMSRRGDGYLRSLMIQGAHAVVQKVRVEATDRGDDRLTRWKRRHGSKGAAIRLANRNLRIVWSLLKHETSYHLPEATMPR